MGALTRFTASACARPGILTGVLGLHAVAAVLARPVHSMVAAPGIEPGFWMLALPLSLAVLALQRLSPASPSRSGSRAWNAYARTVGPATPATASSTASGMSKLA